MTKNYYQTLGVDKKASKDDIKKAFRRLAQKYHPDKSGGDENKFKEINEAYQILSDEHRRKEYDTYGQTFSQGGPSGGSAQGGPFAGFDFTDFAGNGMGFEAGDLGDIFAEFFGGGRTQQQSRGRDISIDIEVSFADSIFGTTRNVLITKVSHCTTWKGSGAKDGSATKKCASCGGKGRLRQTRRSILGNITSETVCDKCFGAGEVPEENCTTCGGAGVSRRAEEVSVAIPSGIQQGEMIRLSGMGEAVPHGRAGDLYVKLHVEAHKTFRRAGLNLNMDLEVKLTDALTGSTYSVQTLDGDLKVKVPEGVTPGEILRVKGYGVPSHGGNRGDLMIKVVVKMPSKLSKKAHALVEELRAEGL